MLVLVLPEGTMAHQGSRQACWGRIVLIEVRYRIPTCNEAAQCRFIANAGSTQLRSRAHPGLPLLASLSSCFMDTPLGCCDAAWRVVVVVPELHGKGSRLCKAEQGGRPRRRRRRASSSHNLAIANSPDFTFGAPLLGRPLGNKGPKDCQGELDQSQRQPQHKCSR